MIAAPVGRCSRLRISEWTPAMILSRNPLPADQVMTNWRNQARGSTSIGTMTVPIITPQV